MTTVQPNLSRATFNQVMAYFMKGILPVPGEELSDEDIEFLINLKGCYNCGETIYAYIPPLDNPHVIVCTRCFEGLYETGYICPICHKSTLNVGFNCVQGVCNSLQVCKSLPKCAISSICRLTLSECEVDPKKHEHPDSEQDNSEHPDSEPDDSEQDNSEPDDSEHPDSESDDSFPHFGEKGISPVSESNPYSDSDSETDIKECRECFNLEDDDPASKLNEEGYCSECACALT